MLVLCSRVLQICPLSNCQTPLENRDKKTATHFTLVHRPQNDPLIHDESAPSMMLNPTQLPNASNVLQKNKQTTKQKTNTKNKHANEGEAAYYGVYYDDTEYD